MSTETFHATVHHLPSDESVYQREYDSFHVANSYPMYDAIQAKGIDMIDMYPSFEDSYGGQMNSADYNNHLPSPPLNSSPHGNISIGSSLEPSTAPLSPTLSAGTGNLTRINNSPDAQPTFMMGCDVIPSNSRHDVLGQNSTDSFNFSSKVSIPGALNMSLDMQSILLNSTDVSGNLQMQSGPEIQSSNHVYSFQQTSHPSTPSSSFGGMYPVFTPTTPSSYSTYQNSNSMYMHGLDSSFYHSHSNKHPTPLLITPTTPPTSFPAPSTPRRNARARVSTAPALLSEAPVKDASGIYTCPEPSCNQQFTKLVQLKSHMKTHNARTSPDGLFEQANKTFPCEDCGTTFKRSHDLRRHRKSLHSGGFKEFFCFTCPKSFSRMDALKRHVSRPNSQCFIDLSSGGMGLLHEMVRSRSGESKFAGEYFE
jgi:hypothetical protein